MSEEEGSEEGDEEGDEEGGVQGGGEGGGERGEEGGGERGEEGGGERVEERGEASGDEVEVRGGVAEYMEDESLRVKPPLNTCPHCGKAFPPGHLARHVKRHHSDQKPTLPCTECGELFLDKEYLDKHRDLKRCRR